MPVPALLLPLRRGLAGADLDPLVASRPGRRARPAAVLALFECPGGFDELGVVVAERASTLRHHPGQIAFPGGAADPGDADAVDTALREAAEEVGLERTGVDVLGVLPAAHVAVSGFDVRAVVAWSPSVAVRVVDRAEVAAVHTVPVAALVDPAHRVRARLGEGYRGPAFVVGDLFIWGLTAHLLDAVLTVAGWNRGWEDAPEVDVPARFVSDRRGTGPDAH